MSDWDADSPALRNNLERAYQLLLEDAVSDRLPSLDAVRKWHKVTMEGLAVPRPSYAGNFRGEALKDPPGDYDDPPLDRCDVQVAGAFGARCQEVEREISEFIQQLHERQQSLRSRLSAAFPQDDVEIEAVLDLAAWVHATWVRIHPFANGNGRTARMWANWVLLRFGMPPLVTLRPRPGGRYGHAGAAAMIGDIAPTVSVFRNMFDDWLASE